MRCGWCRHPFLLSTESGPKGTTPRNRPRMNGPSIRAKCIACAGKTNGTLSNVFAIMEDIPASNNVLSARYTDEEQQDEAVAEFEFIDDPENPENEHPRAKLSLTVFSYLSEWSDVWRI